MSLIGTTDNRHLDDALDEIRVRVDRETITAQIDEFIEVISTDAFLDYVNGIGALPTHSDRRAETAVTAHVDTLEQRGVPTPEGLRLTTREFEVPEDGRASRTPLVRVRPGTDPRMGFCVSLGYIICASYGG
jgi:hypothetical protein